MTTSSSTPAWLVRQEPTGEMRHPHACHMCTASWLLPRTAPSHSTPDASFVQVERSGSQRCPAARAGCTLPLHAQ